MPGNTRTGSVLELTILPALDRGGYQHRAQIEIGAREFMCVGALPPFDHPHVFCDMGDDAEYICPYCSTLYRHDPTLAPNAARPPECTLPSTEL